MCQVADPWGGSYMMESLTNELVNGAQKIIQDIEKKGGMVHFIESGQAKLMVEEAATRKQVTFFIDILLIQISFIGTY